MRTFFASIAGLATAGTVAAFVTGALELSSSGSPTLVVVLVGLAAATILGGFVSARIHTSPRAVSAFALLQLFVTLAAFSWLESPPGWFRLAALLVVVPSAALGGKIAGAPVSERNPAPAATDEEQPTQRDVRPLA